MCLVHMLLVNILEYKVIYVFGTHVSNLPSTRVQGYICVYCVVHITHVINHPGIRVQSHIRV